MCPIQLIMGKGQNKKDECKDQMYLNIVANTANKCSMLFVLIKGQIHLLAF